MRNRTKVVILAAYQRALSLLKSRGLQPELQKLDNEASQVLQQYMVEEHINFQLVPPGLHRRNAAERAIRTFKNHFIAGLCTTAADFPLTLWDQLLPQALMTLNLLRTSRINPLIYSLRLLIVTTNNTIMPDFDPCAVSLYPPLWEISTHYVCCL